MNTDMDSGPQNRSRKIQSAGEVVSSFWRVARGYQQEGRRLPTNQFGEVNKKRIAEEAGFARSCWEENSGLKEALAQALDEIGIDAKSPTGDTARALRRAERSERRGRELEGRLSVSDSTKDALAAEVATLRATVTELQRDLEAARRRIEELEQHERERALEEEAIVRGRWWQR